MFTHDCWQQAVHGKLATADFRSLPEYCNPIIRPFRSRLPRIIWDVAGRCEQDVGSTNGARKASRPSRTETLVQRSADFHRLQLFPGPHLDTLNEKFLARIEYGTQWSNVPKSCIQSCTPEEIVVSLYRWCGEVLLDASTRAFYGNALVDTEPTIIHDFLEFDEHSCMLLYQYPSLFAKAMAVPCERVLQSFERYVSLPPEQRKDTAYFTQSLEAEQIQAGMSSRDRAVGFQIFHFA